MSGDPFHGHRSEPLPPARTHWQELAGRRQSHDAGWLRPVRSGLFAPPAVEPESMATQVGERVAETPELEPDTLWIESVAQEVPAGALTPPVDFEEVPAEYEEEVSESEPEAGYAAVVAYETDAVDDTAETANYTSEAIAYEADAGELEAEAVQFEPEAVDYEAEAVEYEEGAAPDDLQSSGYAVEPPFRAESADYDDGTVEREAEAFAAESSAAEGSAAIEWDEAREPESSGEPAAFEEVAFADAQPEFSGIEAAATGVDAEPPSPWESYFSSVDDEVILESGAAGPVDRMSFEETGDEEEDDELILEISIDDEAEETIFEAHVDDDPESVTDADTPAAAAETEPASMRPGPAPLSAWDLARTRDNQEAERKAANARAEWESFGRQLAESLSFQSEAGTHEVQLTDAVEEKLANAPASAPFPPAVEVEGLQPIGAAFEPLHEETLTPDPEQATSPAPESPAAAPALSELAARLEAFAAALREKGEDALRQPTGGDPVQALLTGIAAGWLGGRQS